MGILFYTSSVACVILLFADSISAYPYLFIRNRATTCESVPQTRYANHGSPIADPWVSVLVDSRGSIFDSRLLLPPSAGAPAGDLYNTSNEIWTPHFRSISISVIQQGSGATVDSVCRGSSYGLSVKFGTLMQYILTTPIGYTLSAPFDGAWLVSTLSMVHGFHHGLHVIYSSGYLHGCMNVNLAFPYTLSYLYRCSRYRVFCHAKQVVHLMRCWIPSLISESIHYSFSAQTGQLPLSVHMWAPRPSPTLSLFHAMLQVSSEKVGQNSHNRDP